MLLASWLKWLTKHRFFNYNKWVSGKLFRLVARKWQTLLVYQDRATNVRDREVDSVSCPSACVHACVYMFAMIMLQPLMSNPGVPCLLPDDRCLARPLGDSQITWQESTKPAGSEKLQSYRQGNIPSLHLQAPYNICLCTFEHSVCKTTDMCS